MAGDFVSYGGVNALFPATRISHEQAYWMDGVGASGADEFSGPSGWTQIGRHHPDADPSVWRGAQEGAGDAGRQPGDDHPLPAGVSLVVESDKGADFLGYERGAKAA
jgi:hypothetical protein